MAHVSSTVRKKQEEQWRHMKALEQAPPGSRELMLAMYELESVFPLEIFPMQSRRDPGQAHTALSGTTTPRVHAAHRTAHSCRQLFDALPRVTSLSLYSERYQRYPVLFLPAINVSFCVKDSADRFSFEAQQRWRVEEASMLHRALNTTILLAFTACGGQHVVGELLCTVLRATSRRIWVQVSEDELARTRRSDPHCTTFQKDVRQLQQRQQEHRTPAPLQKVTRRFSANRSCPTKFQGVVMRSRTEAKHAFLLHHMGIPYVYEPEDHEVRYNDTTGYAVDGKRVYTPDFWLPTMNIILEIKGRIPSGDEVKKCRYASLAFPECIVVMFYGTVANPYAMKSNYAKRRDNRLQSKVFKCGEELRGSAAWGLYSHHGVTYPYLYVGDMMRSEPYLSSGPVQTMYRLLSQHKFEDA